MSTATTMRSTEWHVSLIVSGILAGIIMMALVLLTTPAQAQACSVPSDYATIQAAVDDDTCATITVEAGTYTEELTIERSLTLQGAGITETIMDGDSDSRPITINRVDDGSDPVVVRIERLRVTNGDATSAAPRISFFDRIGGGILVDGGAILFLADAQVDKNIANDGDSGGGFGGGIGVRAGSTLHMQNVQLDNNIASRSTFGGRGGGLALTNGAVYLTDTLVLSNTAKAGGGDNFGYGGGLYASQESDNEPSSQTAIMRIIDSQIYSNTATTLGVGGRGGGLYVSNSDNTQVELQDNDWKDNVARNNLAGIGDGEGGAIAIVPTEPNTANVTITNDQFLHNIANAADDLSSSDLAQGGAILLNTDNAGNITAAFTNLTLTENIAKSGTGRASGQGGAIYANNSTIAFEGGTLIGNKAGTNDADTGSGGGVHLQNSPMTATNLVMRNNVALEDGAPTGTNLGQGGGIAVFNESETASTLAITNSFVVDNMAAAATANGQGAAIYLADANQAEPSTLVHVTLASAEVNPDAAVFVASGSLSVTNTIVTSHTIGLQNDGDDDVVQNYMLFFGNTENITGSITGDTGTVAGDPVFVDPENGNYFIEEDSAAIDAGTDAGVTTDIDGTPRPSGDGFDIGADEYITPVNVTAATIIGSTSGPPGEYTFSVDVTPANTTTPISYLWDNGDTTATSTRTLEVGVSTISVTVTNNAGQGVATDTLDVTINEVPDDCTVPLTGVTLIGPVTGTTGTAYEFAAQTVPANATTPISYTWSPEPDTGQGTATARYRWPTAGSKTIAVTAQNCGGTQSATQNIIIGGPGAVPDRTLYLPLVGR